MATFTTIATTAKIKEVRDRVSQLMPGVGKNQEVRSGEFNALIDLINTLIGQLNTLNTGLTNYADDAAAATGGVAIGGLYRTGSVISVRVA